MKTIDLALDTSHAIDVLIPEFIYFLLHVFLIEILKSANLRPVFETKALSDLIKDASKFPRCTRKGNSTLIHHSRSSVRTLNFANALEFRSAAIGASDARRPTVLILLTPLNKADAKKREESSVFAMA